MISLIAAGLVVLAHVVDAVSQRRRPDRDGWGHSLALALCGVAAIGLVLGGTLADTPADLVVILATGVAVTVSMIPLLGHRDVDAARARPSSPWDRAYRMQPGRVAQLLAPPRRATPRPVVRDATPREGVVVENGVSPQTPSAQPQQNRRRGTSTPASDPVVREAEETLHDVTEVVGDLGRLLGLDPRRERR
ncbi:MAG: hypothetical protein Q4G43_06335 [Mobilicoccus sp.]|nr:hypothetical protein [Mobilicoccus sp.]